ncbi:cytokine-dependent hematopoietic cell linker isoform X1 [Castor canadensis]|uniref:Cytokine-dependent hematopoietic cell linker isoform X1 n=2 Tax=Castor canadensis TaxID=51338 RepID=A0AC58K1C4_CASCN
MASLPAHSMDYNQAIKVSLDSGQYQTINQPLPHLDHKRNFTAVLDGAKCHSDDDYEDPELQLAEAWTSMKILPARPIKESEYADTRYFKGVMDTSLLLHPKSSISCEEQTWNLQMRREAVDKPIPKDLKSQHFKGGKSTKGNKTPLPPPRPPVPLPKKYQPLPLEPPESRTSCPQRQIVPEALTGTRKGGCRDASISGGQREVSVSVKDLSEVLGAGKVSHHQIKSEPTHPSQSQNTYKIPDAIASSPFMPRNHSRQDTDHKGSMQSSFPQRCQSPDSYDPHENALLYKNTSQRKPFPTRSDEKDVQHNEWYIGKYSRQAVEKALMKENKDGTFLVRDCSTKSKAEPYVLVVFCGNKVYNVKIRFLERNQQFALGTGLRGDKKFDSVEDIIEHYKSFPIILIDGKDKTGVHREQCHLTQPLPVARHFSPSPW